MNKLKKQIAKVNREIMIDNAVIKEHELFLRKKLESSQVLFTAMMGVFAIGFIISRKKSLPETARLLATTSFKVTRLYRNIKLLFPLLPI